MKQTVILSVAVTAILCSSAAFAQNVKFYPPWECKVEYEISRGNAGTDGGHPDDQYNKYSWDIKMAEGTPIRAPLDGQIKQIKEDSNVNGLCLQSGAWQYSNYVTLCAKDPYTGKEFSIKFLHLQQNSVPFKVGDYVKQGDIIAKSGNTGSSCGAHLHFSAIASCNDAFSNSIPSEWIDIGKPVSGNKIVSNNCPDEPCKPSPEICDGKDNDCDGNVDNGFEICPESYQIKYQSMNYDPQNTDINGDGMADICIRGKNGIECMISDGKEYTKYVNVLPEMKDGSVWSGDKYYRSIRFADINGDGKADICARNTEGILCWPSTGTAFGKATTVLPMSDADGYVSGDDGSNNPAAKAYLSSVRFGDIDGDHLDDVCARFKDNFKCYLSDGSGFKKEIVSEDLKDPGWVAPQYLSTFRMADVDGDSRMDICVRGDNNVYCWFWDEKNNKLSAEVKMNNWGAKNNWGAQKYYTTIRLADVNGDGKADLCGRDAKGIVCQLSKGREAFGTEIRGPEWPDSVGWDDYDNYSTIMFGDLNGDTKDDVCARADGYITCHLSTGDGFKGGEHKIETLSNATHWNKPEYFRTLHMGDIDGDGRMDICGRGPNGVQCFLFNGEGFTEVKGPAWKDSDGWNAPQYYSTMRFGGPFGNPCSKREEICDDQLDNNCNGQVDENCPPACTPSDEVCDGKDNNCNGEVDEGLECPPESECVPQDEICDKIDNDCDGEIDEDLECPPESECVPQDEICDKIDNDCDGEIDEDLECPPESECVPKDEICDKIDNDCDGEIDEGLDCTPDPGCVPSDEICDQKDNDCDGLIDEDSICTPSDICESPDGCPTENLAEASADDDCGCSVKRTPNPHGGIAWLLGMFGMIGMMRLRRNRS